MFLEELGQRSGRYGDSMMAHVTPGDIVIPQRIVEEEPEFLVKLKNAFKKYNAMNNDNTDYRSHIVGSPHNSMNPETGMPEFGLGDFFDPIIGIGKALFGGKRKATLRGPTAAPFAPTRPSEMGVPESLQGQLGGMSPVQQRSLLTTQGTQGGGIDQAGQDYYKNLLSRSLIGESGQLGEMGSLLPVETQYLSRQGLPVGSSTYDFLKAYMR